MAKSKTFRLKKGPQIQDYVVETTTQKMSGISQAYKYFDLRSEARAYAKECHKPGVHVRVFRIKYTKVQELK